MTFYIDWWEQDPPMMRRILRIRDDTRYVQDHVDEEHLLNMHQLSRYDRQVLLHQLLKLLCEKWYKLFGERIEPIAPEAEGVGWGIGYVEQKEVTDAERPSIEGGRHER